MKKWFSVIWSIPRKVLYGTKVDKAVQSIEDGYKYMKLFEAFMRHFKAFNEDRRRILGITLEVPKVEKGEGVDNVK